MTLVYLSTAWLIAAPGHIAKAQVLRPYTDLRSLGGGRMPQTVT